MRTVPAAAVLLLLAAPLAGADPVTDLYGGAAETVDLLDDAASSAAAQIQTSAEQAAGAVVGPVEQALAGAGGTVPSGSVPGVSEWVGVGTVDASFTLTQGEYACADMQAMVEHRTPLSNEPSFLLSLAAGQGSPASLCVGGLRAAMSRSEWSGDYEHGWHAARYDTPDARAIEITVGPRGPDGARPLTVFWDIDTNGVYGVYHIAGSLKEVVVA
jgi:hypothetical protein